jgi:hypothetical protein
MNIRVIIPLFAAMAATTAAVAQTQTAQGAGIQASSSDRRIACYREVQVPAEYRVEQHLVTPAQQYYFRRLNGVVELRERPAVYHEERILVNEARVVMQEVPCPG